MLLNFHCRLKESTGDTFGPDPGKARTDYVSIFGKGEVSTYVGSEMIMAYLYKHFYFEDCNTTYRLNLERTLRQSWKS